MMLSMDTIVLEILNQAKSEGNQLLKHFIIQHPDKRVSEESNSVFVTCVSSENNLDGYDFTRFKDLVEILIVTKQRDYTLAINVIKTLSYEICRLIMENRDKFPNKPIIRNVNPEFNRDYVLTRGHILVEVVTDPFDFEVSDEMFDCVVSLFDEDIEVK